MVHSAPRYADDQPIKDGLVGLSALRERPGIELAYDVDGAALIATLATLRDVHGYQQLMEIAGVDFPDRPDRFEIVYCLLSVTKNHRIRIHVSTDEDRPVPSVTALWPVAGWLEREVFDMYGVVFSDNNDLRRILTDYGFKGHPQRKDFPLTGYVELRYSEEDKRVVYEPVKLAQDFRSFDFMSPWEGAQYVLPGDEKAPAQPGAPTSAAAPPPPAAAAPSSAPTVDKPKVTQEKADTGAGEAANAKAAEPSADKKPRAPRKPKAAADDDSAAPEADVKPKRKPAAPKTPKGDV